MSVRGDRNGPGYTRADLLRDGCLLSGLGLVSFGAYQVYAPAGLIVPGAILLLLAFVGRP